MAIGLRVGLVLFCGIAVAWFTTSGTPYFEPSPATLWLGVIIASLALLAPPRYLPATAVLGALALGGAAGRVLLEPGMPRVHDLMHLWGLWSYGRSVAEGSLYPLWSPHLGAGLPLLQFYGPLNFLLGLPGILLELSPVGTWKLELFLGHLLSALSMLGAARLLGVGWRGCLVAAAAGAFGPWRLAVFDYRGALGEANAYLFMPWVAAGALRMLRAPAMRVACVLALAVVGLVLTHLLSLFTLVVVLLPVCAAALARAPSGERRKRLLGAAIPLVAALGISAAWWLPALIESRQTSMRQTTADNPYYAYAENGATPAGMVQRRAWDALRVSIPRTERRERGLEGEQMPFYAGAVLMLAALSVGWWSRRRENWAPAAGVALGLALSTAIAAGLTAWLPGFATIRFPWRLLSPATVLAGLALALGVEALRRNDATWREAILPGLLLVALAWDGAPYTSAADRIPPYEGIVHWHTDERNWLHWERSMQPVQVKLTPEQGVARVRNLELPPSDYDAQVDWFYPAYYEWFTPEVYENYWKVRHPAAMEAAGVRYGFTQSRSAPVVWQARPYASVLSIDGTHAPDNVSRRPGRIRVDLDVPAKGSRLLILEQWFPGWRVRVDGGAWSIPRNEDGFMATPLPPGRHRVELHYGLRTPARLTGLTLTLLTLLTCTALFGKGARNRFHSLQK